MHVTGCLVVPSRSVQGWAQRDGQGVPFDARLKGRERRERRQLEVRWPRHARRGIRFTCMPPAGPIVPTLRPRKCCGSRARLAADSDGSARETSYKWKKWARRTLASIIAKLRPMHDRGWKVNGQYLYDCGFLALVPPANSSGRNSRSGLNSSTSSPQKAGFMCMAHSPIIRLVPLGMVTRLPSRPVITSSNSVSRKVPLGTEGQKRSVSVMTRVKKVICGRSAYVMSRPPSFAKTASTSACMRCCRWGFRANSNVTHVIRLAVVSCPANRNVAAVSRSTACAPVPVISCRIVAICAVSGPCTGSASSRDGPATRDFPVTGSIERSTSLAE
mmetsp:Transcript_22222/g.57963  ORF Transcript_22222/g.57963 Transcript_22222/m.57963 type:complete len:331 (-) Transcript_22222:872-1864(-)